MIKNKILFSVIIPSYNQGIYLDDCLNSVINQSYDNWECIIVDDGSTDNTYEIAKKWILKYNNIKYYKNTNHGLSYSRNYGISKSSGAYILPLDADDTINTLYLEKAYKLLKEQSDIGILYCKARKFGVVNKDWILPDYNFSSFLINNCIFCSAFFSRTDWELTKGYDVNMKSGYEDWEFWIRLLTKTNKKVKRLNYVGFNYRVKESSMITNLYDSEEKRIKVLNYIQSKHENLYNKYFPSKIVILQEKELLEKKYNDLRLKTDSLKSTFLYKAYKYLIK